MSTKQPLYKDVVILGAGAAGLMCAIEAAKRGRSVVVLEHNNSVGKKIRISGGGRCNFTNIHATPKNYLSQNPHFCKSALARYTPADFLELVKKHKIPYHEKKLGQLFCDTSAQIIIEMLKKECQQYKVEILLEAKVLDIQKKDRFSISTSVGQLEGQSVVVACGGLSIPTLGATNLGYSIAQQFDIKTVPCRPGLVPLTLKDKDILILKELAGVSVDVLVSFGEISFRENILFTHKGLSGPAILQISSYWQPGKPIIINWLPDPDMSVDHLPRRLTKILGTSEDLHHWEITPQGTEGYAKAEVTVGGVDTDELSSKTIESKKVAGLYFIGEVVDVTGHLGGFNFQWAWASGFAAGQYA